MDSTPAPYIMRDLLDLHDVARVCNVSERMARRIIEERRVPIVKVGRHVRVRAADLESYLAANTQPAVTARR